MLVLTYGLVETKEEIIFKFGAYFSSIFIFDHVWTFELTLKFWNFLCIDFLTFLIHIKLQIGKFRQKRFNGFSCHIVMNIFNHVKSNNRRVWHGRE